MSDLLRRAWDALDSFKQAYPEGWHEDDEQVMKDLLRADLQLAGLKLKWVGLTDEEMEKCFELKNLEAIVEEVEAKLKEKNHG
jgi:hypothetical protein